jgi:hypothetical protein
MYPAPKVRHYKLVLDDTTPSLVITENTDEVHFGVSLRVQNIDDTAIVYVGNADTLTSTEFGIKLAPGAIASFDNLPKYPNIGVLSNTSDSEVTVMRISK